MKSTPPSRATRAASAALRLLLVAASLSVGLLAGEVAVRIQEGFPVLALRLPSRSPGRPEPELADLAASLPLGEGVDPAWIDLVPPPLAGRKAPSHAQLRQRDIGVARGGLESDLYRQWNSLYVEGFGCRPDGGLQSLPPPLLVFEAPEPHPHPVYRQPLESTTPLGLVTGAQGWRGPDVPLDKSANTIRVAFVGASTTIGPHWFPFSYPEYVVHWLNLWAKQSRLHVRFDGINAAREGLKSAGIAAIVRQEVLPMEPDLVVYYEGANQFRFGDLVDVETSRPTEKNFSLAPPAWADFAFTLKPFSALVRLADAWVQGAAIGDGCEPAKPDYRLAWPEGVDEFEPDPDSALLPLHLPRIVADLDTMRGDLEGIGAELAVSSFVWMVDEGLCIDGAVYPVYTMLNRRWWPFRYRDLRRMADFQNRVFARYAGARGLLFVDEAAFVPHEPSLFTDAVHFSRPGTRVQAWGIFLGLLPRIRERLASGAWPRADRAALLEHPNIRAPMEFEGCADFLHKRQRAR